MRGFGKDAEAAGSKPDQYLERGDHQRSQNGVPRSGTLFSAHQLRGWNRRAARHGGIIAVGSLMRQADRWRSLLFRNSGVNWSTSYFTPRVAAGNDINLPGSR